MTTDNQSLPPLPAPYSAAHEDAGSFWPDTFSAQQLQAYGDTRAAHARKVALEEAAANLADAWHADCEHGFLFMNARALEVFRRTYPNLDNAIKELK
jgi:hypothetical protein